MVGRCIAYWNSPFLGDMLVFRGVSQVVHHNFYNFFFWHLVSGIQDPFVCKTSPDAAPTFFGGLFLESSLHWKHPNVYTEIELRFWSFGTWTPIDFRFSLLPNDRMRFLDNRQSFSFLMFYNKNVQASKKKQSHGSEMGNWVKKILDQKFHHPTNREG